MTVTTPRRRISTMQRLKIFEAHGGRCYLCDGKIFGKWDVEHKRALALGGADDESNMVPAHKSCHALKTQVDRASWDKAKRTKAKHVGAYRSRTPMPGSKGTRFRKRMDGTVEVRR